MALKTRAELKAENATDFPDNLSEMISPADLRGQMDDVVDSAVFPEDLERVVTVTASNYSLSDADDGALLYFTVPAAVIVQVPTGLSQTFDCRIVQGGLGQITVLPVGTTIHSLDNRLSSAKQYALLSLRALAADEFLLSGDAVRIDVEQPQYPQNVSPPFIMAGSGFSASVDVGTWTNDPLTFAFQWYRDTVLIDGATAQTYYMTDADVGTLLTVNVTATNGFGSGSATSAGYPVVGAAPANTILPSITGGSSPPKVGENLSIGVGGWTGTPTPTFARQWKSNNVAVSGATGTVYVPTVNDVGKTITCTVTATNVVGSASATSAATGAVVASLDTTGPTLSAFSVTPTSETTAQLSVTTNEGNGTFYWTIQLDGLAAPTAAQVRAGTDGSNNPAYSKDSILITGIDTWWRNPSGLSAGTIYDAYGAQYDAAGNASNVVTVQFTMLGSGIPVLGAPAAFDFADTFAWFNVDTNSGSGTLYVVVVPQAEATPTKAQIKAGQNASGVAAPSKNQAVTITGTKTLLVRGLTANTPYKACFVHSVTAGDSAIAIEEFTSDVLVLARAHDGTAAGFSAPSVATGTDAFGVAVADPFGGNLAINFNDNNDGLGGTVSAIVNPLTVYNGITKYHFCMKHRGGAQNTRVSPGNLGGGGGLVQVNAVTGAIGTNGWLSATPLSLAAHGTTAAGWWMWSGTLNHTQTPPGDVTGILTFALSDATNGNTVTIRDNSHSRDLFDVRITRPA